MCIRREEGVLGTVLRGVGRPAGSQAGETRGVDVHFGGAGTQRAAETLNWAAGQGERDEKL